MSLFTDKNIITMKKIKNKSHVFLIVLLTIGSLVVTCIIISYFCSPFSVPSNTIEQNKVLHAVEDYRADPHSYELENSNFTLIDMLLNGDNNLFEKYYTDYFSNIINTIKQFYGTFTIPAWMRIPHKPLQEVENYHSDLDFNDIDNSSLPRVDVLLDPDYKLGKKEYTECCIKITNAGEYNLASCEAKIKIRGNSTSVSDKKPYKIKFLKKKAVLGGSKEKNWVLLANANDNTGLHNYVSLELYRYLSAPGTFIPMVQFVNLYINGKYQGVYNLCDQIEPGKNRVPISSDIKARPEDTDYLIVNDDYASSIGQSGEKDVNWFWLDKSFTPIEIKSPDTSNENYSTEYTDYIKNRIENIYNVILSRDWEKIQKSIDIDSMINGFIVSIITDNVDIAYKSIYYYLPAGGKLTYGPVWDMDLTFGAGKTSFFVKILGEKSELNAIWKQLMEIDEFKKAFCERFKTVYPNLESFISEKINEAINIAGKELENEFMIRSRWVRYGDDGYTDAQSYEEAVSYMINWTHKRLNYLYSIYCN